MTGTAITPAGPSSEPLGPVPERKRPVRAAIAWGVVVGAIQAASPLAFWWLDPATVYAVGLAVIASVYIGFAVADREARIIVVGVWCRDGIRVVAAVGITGSAWLLASGLAAHGV